MPKKTTGEIGTMTYEQAYQELEKIIGELESSPPVLNTTLQLYERGQLLARHCSKLLDQSELKIRQVTGEGIARVEEE